MVLTPSKPHIARSFGLKASRYDTNAVIQGSLIDRVLPHVASHASAHGRWIDLGCGTGLLLKKSGRGRFIGLDIAIEPLRSLYSAGHPVLLSDIDALPFKPGSFEGVVTTSALQWLKDPCSFAEHAAYLLQPQGFCVASIFVSGSFEELFAVRSAFDLAQSVRCPQEVAVQKSFSAAGMVSAHEEIVQETRYYSDAASLLKTLNAIGAGATAGRALSRSEIAEFCRVYEQKFKNDRGVPLTYRSLLCVFQKRGNH